MKNLVASLFVLLGSSALASCGSSAPDPKIAEAVKKQVVAQCSMEYLNTGIAPEQKETLCDCTAEGVLASIDLPEEGEFRRVKVTLDELAPILDKCESEAGVSGLRAE